MLFQVIICRLVVVVDCGPLFPVHSRSLVNDRQLKMLRCCWGDVEKTRALHILCWFSSAKLMQWLGILTWQPGKIHIDIYWYFIGTSPAKAIQGTSNNSDVQRQRQQQSDRTNNQGIISYIAHHCDVAVLE